MQYTRLYWHRNPLILLIGRISLRFILLYSTECSCRDDHMFIYDGISPRDTSTLYWWIHLFVHRSAGVFCIGWNCRPEREHSQPLSHWGYEFRTCCGIVNPTELETEIPLFYLYENHDHVLIYDKARSSFLRFPY
jgi:hypothetical protein